MAFTIFKTMLLFIFINLLALSSTLAGRKSSSHLEDLNTTSPQRLKEKAERTEYIDLGNGLVRTLVYRVINGKEKIVKDAVGVSSRYFDFINTE